MAEATEDSGPERAAILLLSLGEQEAAQVLKHMEPGEVQKVGTAMAALKGVSREQMQRVLQNFLAIADNPESAAGDTQEYLRRVLTHSVGKQRAELFLQRIEPGGTTGGNGIDSLKWMDAKSVMQIIGGEHPQIIAIVLSQLHAELAGKIMELFPEALRSDVLMRIATLDEIPQSALTELDQLVERQSGAAPQAPMRRVGGTKIAADIVNAIDRVQTAQLLETIEKSDAELHQKIKDLMFTFDNLMQVDDRGIQTLLREISSDQLVLALRGAEPAMQDKIFRNMSKRVVEILKDDMEARGPVKLSQVEAAQKEIVAVAQQLIEAGTIVIGGRAVEYV
jgi:flagellar motor switch protein FliG